MDKVMRAFYFALATSRLQIA